MGPERSRELGPLETLQFYHGRPSRPSNQHTAAQPARSPNMPRQRKRSAELPHAKPGTSHPSNYHGNCPTLQAIFTDSPRSTPIRIHRMRRIAVFIGTRPEAIKMAPVVAALTASDRFEPLVVNTGQHRELIDQVIKLFGIQVDHDLAVMAPNQSLTPLLARSAGTHRRRPRRSSSRHGPRPRRHFDRARHRARRVLSPDSRSATSKPAFAPATCNHPSPKKQTVS